MLYRGLAEADLSGEGIVRLIQGGTVVKVHLDRQATNISLPVAFYLLCGLAAAMGQILADPSSAIPMLGASGAISGVMGGYLLLYPNVRVFAILPIGFFITSIALPAWAMLGYWFLIQFVSGLAAFGSEIGGVAFWAHVGGFVAGVVLVKLLARSDYILAHRAHHWRPRRLMRD